MREYGIDITNGPYRPTVWKVGSVRARFLLHACSMLIKATQSMVLEYKGTEAIEASKVKATRTCDRKWGEEKRKVSCRVWQVLCQVRKLIHLRRAVLDWRSHLLRVGFRDRARTTHDKHVH